MMIVAGDNPTRVFKTEVIRRKGPWRTLAPADPRLCRATDGPGPDQEGHHPLSEALRRPRDLQRPDRTLVWVDWFNLRRLLGPIGDIPPAEFEAQYYQQAEVA